MDDALAIYDTLPEIALHFIRAGAFISVVPVFGSQASSRMLRVILALTIGSIMWWTGGQQATRRSSTCSISASSRSAKC